MFHHLILVLIMYNIPFGMNHSGDFTYYTDSGYGACGTYIDAATEDLVAVSRDWFTNPNPNIDPLCHNVCFRVNYNGNSIKVPVKDMCPSCDKSHLDLSKPAFEKLADPSVGHVYGATWSFERC